MENKNFMQTLGGVAAGVFLFVLILGTSRVVGGGSGGGSGGSSGGHVKPDTNTSVPIPTDSISLSYNGFEIKDGEDIGTLEESPGVYAFYVNSSDYTVKIEAMSSESTCLYWYFDSITMFSNTPSTAWLLLNAYSWNKHIPGNDFTSSFEVIRRNSSLPGYDSCFSLSIPSTVSYQGETADVPPLSAVLSKKFDQPVLVTGDKPAFRVTIDTNNSSFVFYFHVEYSISPSN